MTPEELDDVLLPWQKQLMAHITNISKIASLINIEEMYVTEKISEPPTAFFAWMDVETTGLKAADEELLQVSLLITDQQLNILAPVKEWTLFYDEQDVENMKAWCDAVVLEMHTASGLWDKLGEGSGPNFIQQAILDYIATIVPPEATLMLAGNSVRLDFNFLEYHMHLVAERLHYRVLDVTGIAQFAKDSFGIDTPRKRKAHTAAEDIMESLTQLRQIREGFRKLIRGEIKFPPAV